VPVHGGGVATLLAQPAVADGIRVIGTAGRMPLQDAEQALDLHQSGKKTGRVVLLPGTRRAENPKC